MNKVIRYTPAFLLLLGIFLGSHYSPGKDWAFYFGSGLGLLGMSAVPAALFGTIHFSMSKKKMTGQDFNQDTLDSSEAEAKKLSWYNFFCGYLLGFGLVCAILVVIGSS